ncbi:MAG: hypothetical protein IT424_01840 [Pirellulales bacterium]|nr:hypothetical protein [Pirellulales bacterium]
MALAGAPIWFRRAAATSLAVLLAVGLLLAARRIGGAASAEIPASKLTATAVAAAAVVFGGRWAFRLAAQPAGEVPLACPSRGFHVLGTLALASLAMGCSLPGRRAVDWICWLPLLGADAWQFYWLYFRAPRRPRTADASVPRRAPKLVQYGREAEGQSAISAAACAAEVQLADDCLQEVRRIRGQEGVEAIAAALRAEFVAGQRHAILHVGFCPPLASDPTLEVGATGGPTAEVRVLQAFTHGARLEVRLAEAARAACSVIVELTALPAAGKEEL